MNTAEKQKCTRCGKEITTADVMLGGKCKECAITEKQLFQVQEKQKFLLVEDGSVDLEQLDRLGINYIVYRQGSEKPQWIEI